MHNARRFVRLIWHFTVVFRTRLRIQKNAESITRIAEVRKTCHRVYFICSLIWKIV